MKMQEKSKRTSIVGIFLAIVMMFSLAVTSYADENGNEIKITLLATTDIHGRYMPWDYALDGENKNGSITQISTIVKEIRKENPNTLLFETGDLIQDNSAELFKELDNHPATLAINKMGYDVWTLGNHEFDYGFKILDNIIKKFDGVILAGNVYEENGKQYYPSYTIIEKAGIKFGVIGMTTPMVQEFKEDTDIFDGKTLKNPTEETKKTIKELEGKVDIIIGVMHMGLDNENNTPNTGVTDIANACPELAVIFAGHMHTLIESEVVNTVLITEPDKYATHVSRVDLTFERQNNTFVLKDKKASVIKVSSYESDTELEKIIAPYHKIARDDANIVVGELKTMDFVPKTVVKGIPTVQIQETALSNFIGEVMLYYSNGADVVAYQIDNDNAGLPMGPIKKKDIAYNYQYAGGEVTVYEVTGKDLKDYMEWSAGYFNTAKPGDVTISFDKTRRNSKYSTDDFFLGVKYEIDLSKEYGNRIINLTKPDGTPIKPEDKLKLGMNAYRMKALIGKGGALEGRVFKQVYSTQEETAFGEIEGRIRNLAARYIQEVKNGVIEGKLNNTWKIVGVEETPTYVIELVNDDILEIPKLESGRTNVESINIKAVPTQEEIGALAKKINADPGLFSKVKDKGELYQQINEFRKAGTQTKDKTKEAEVTKLEEKPVEVNTSTAKEPVLTTSVDSSKTYIVKSGDVLWKVGKLYNVDWKILAEFNHLNNPNLIYPGQTILIP